MKPHHDPNEFPRGMITDGDGRHRPVARISCACGASTTIPIASRRSVATEYLAKFFRAKGWVVGRKRAQDRCPACAKPARPEAVAIPPTPDPVPKETTMTTAKVLAEPRLPTRDQSRAILDEIDAAYPKAGEGYKAGHSDETVARKLNIPRAWVTDIRDRFYGPEFVVDVAALELRLKKLEGDLSALTEGTLSLIASMEKDRDALRLDIGRIQKAVSR